MPASSHLNFHYRMKAIIRNRTMKPAPAHGLIEVPTTIEAIAADGGEADDLVREAIGRGAKHEDITIEVMPGPLRWWREETPQ